MWQFSVGLLRTGDLVAMLLPAVGGKRVVTTGMVLSVWTCQRKPKLATTATPMSHVVCFRAAVLEQQHQCKDPRALWCNGASKAWVIKPESVVAVLAYEQMEDNLDHCSVTLTAESMAILEVLSCFALIL